MFSYRGDSSIRLWNEARVNEFYLSGDPEATPNYPLKSYEHPGVIHRLSDEEDEQRGVWVQQAVTDPGEMLIVENCLASCECIRDCSPYTEQQPTHAPTPVPRQPLHRIPPKAHQQLAHNFAEQITIWMASEMASNTTKLKLESFGALLDARPNLSAFIPVNLQGGMNTESSPEKRGPWKEVEADVEKTLDYERMWNIIANNARCFKVRSKRRGEPSQVETCESWGMWLMTSFINHSCRPNCHAMRVGDAIIIRAARALEAGEELTLPYFDIFQPLCQRQLDAQRWGFRCHCGRCEVERKLGKPYKSIQKKIVNLEEQIQRSSDLKDVKGRNEVTRYLLKNLKDLMNPTRDLLERFGKLMSEGTEIPYLDADELQFCTDCIWASFSKPLIAWYTICQQDAHDAFVTGYTAQRRLKAKSLQSLIFSVTSILVALTNIHPGNLLCQELYAVLIKARNDLIDRDLDENLAKDVGLQESCVTVANQFCRSYYGPHFKVFQLMNRWTYCGVMAAEP